MKRETRQRQAIRRVFQEHPAPLLVGDILQRGQRHLPSLSQATVYRAVRDLVTDGVLAVVELPGEPPRYEPAGKQHHHHFVCRSCGVVFELEGCLPGWRSLVPEGFRVEAHEIVLYGSCRPCSIDSTSMNDRDRNAARRSSRLAA
ncbi:MAG: transcriptional repressor [Candidatus Methylacidiphilales bacterium]|nr:transcriptional repressor [Candidatus Methylacidiphilales bacterium]